MTDIVLSGYPTGITSLSDWESALTSVQKDIITGQNFYKLLNHGYMNQSMIYNIPAKTSIAVKFTYALINAETMNDCVVTVGITFKDSSYDTIMFPLMIGEMVDSITTKWTEVENSYTVPDGKSVTNLSISIRNNSEETTLRITDISMLTDVQSSVENSQYNTKDFQDLSILYGLDSDKPVLR